MALHCITHGLVCLTLLVLCEQYTQQTFCLTTMKRRNIDHIVGHKCYNGQPSPIKTGECCYRPCSWPTLAIQYSYSINYLNVLEHCLKINHSQADTNVQSSFFITRGQHALTVT